MPTIFCFINKIPFIFDAFKWVRVDRHMRKHNSDSGIHDHNKISTSLSLFLFVYINWKLLDNEQKSVLDCDCHCQEH